MNYQEKYVLAKKMYLEEKKSLTEISKILGIDRGSLSKNLKKDGVKIINRQNTNSRNSSVFEKIDTEEKAYWLGFLYADGYVSSNTNNIELALKESDKGHIEKFKKFIGGNNKISKKTVVLNGNKYNAYRICFRDKKMKRDLIKKGCVPNKSLILKFPNNNIVPYHLMKHFLRGYWDGDGSLIFTNKTYRISVISTKDFIKGMLNFTGWKSYALQEEGEAYRWECNHSGKIPNMIDLMYKDANIYLDRKYKKYNKMANAV